jgi:ribulose-5-phosphate 4-epimerase/fuculose-1-phosphate aldolase
MTEGVIKFSLEWERANPLLEPVWQELARWREILYQKKWIGMDAHGIGYGNLSIRENDFIITGSGTGRIRHLNGSHFTRVVDYNFSKNWLRCSGPIEASSESMTHAAVYESLPEVKAVFHIHHLQMWERWKDRLPTTSANVEYGTSEMAQEVMRLTRKDPQSRVLVMAGHREGLIAYGTSLQETGEALLALEKQN